MKVLIVEDDKATAEMLHKALKSQSYTTDVSFDGAEGSFLARSYDYDVIILDYSLPKKNGLEVCTDIRGAGKTTPILFLSSTDEINTKVEALERGADDYMTKPFSIDELDARLRALFRRPQKIESHTLNVSDLFLDTKSHTVKRGNSHIHLTRKEYNLLEYLMRNKGTTLSRSMILEHVWTSDSDPFSNTIEAHIRNLRKKINIDDKPNLIANVPGRGYILDTPENIDKVGVHFQGKNP